MPHVLPVAVSALLIAGVAETAAADCRFHDLTIAADDRRIVLDLEALDALPQHSFETGTIWTDGVALYSGVPLATLLAEVGVEAGRVELVALNDYRVEIPVEEIGPEVPIVASRIDGETMTVRDKGPYWLVYPYDSAPQFRTEDIYTRSVWQLVRLNLID